MKRRIAVITLFVLLGAILNIGIAWGAMLRDPPPHPLSSAYARPSLKDPAALMRRYLPGVNPDQYLCYGNMYQGVGWRELVASSFTDMSATNIPATVSVLQAGWPLPALEGYTMEHNGEAKHAAFFSLTGAAPNPLATHHEQLPCAPIWPGFIINTLLYALLLWLVFASPFTIRSAIRNSRRRRGLCEKCAYPIGTSPICTECGAAVSGTVH